MIQNLWHNNFVTMLRHFYVVANESDKFRCIVISQEEQEKTEQ